MNPFVPTLFCIPCPFCGSDEANLETNDTSWFVFCERCNANGPTADMVDDAIAKWNHRADAAEGKAESSRQAPGLGPDWRCPKCLAFNFAIRTQCRFCPYVRSGPENNKDAPFSSTGPSLSEAS